MKHFRFSEVCLVLFAVFCYPAIVMWICKMDTVYGAEFYRDLAWAYTNICMSFVGLLISLATIYYFDAHKTGQINNANRWAGIFMAATFIVLCLILYIHFYRNITNHIDKNSVMIPTLAMTIVPFVWSFWYIVILYKNKNIKAIH
jgi:hypothetical protein